MRIGMDVSIECCRAEGYMVMDYPVHAFKASPTTVDCRFTRSIPEYARDGFIGEKIIMVDIMLNWEDLFETYLEHKSGIDSMIGGSYKKTDTPEPYMLLNLASDIDMYCGII